MIYQYNQNIVYYFFCITITTNVIKPIQEGRDDFSTIVPVFLIEIPKYNRESLISRIRNKSKIQMQSLYLNR